MDTQLLKIEDLSVQYTVYDSTVHAVTGLSLEIGKGECVGLVGETGAGKTTTALSIMGLIPDPPGKIVGGRILFGGRDLTTVSQKEFRQIRGKQISMVFQDPMTSLNPVVKIGEQVLEAVILHEKLSRIDAVARAHEMLELVGIPALRASDYPNQFSGGMRQRVMIAMALACNPQLLVADEPTTALDVTIQAQVLDLIRGLRDRLGTAMLLITHDLGVVAEICDKVAVMYAGSVVESGSVREVYGRTLHPYTKGLFDSLPDLEHDKERLSPIPGMMPEPTDLPEGCVFAPRCPYATDLCHSQRPEPEEASPGHSVACFHRLR